VGVSSPSCRDFVHTGLPCVDVPRCGHSQNGIAVINQTSTGKGFSQSNSVVSLCFDNDFLYVNHTAHKQSVLDDPGYSKCCDPIFNSNVAEFFISPLFPKDGAGPQCYSELDLSPFDVLWNAGIYNPNRTSRSIQGFQFPCSGMGVTTETHRGNSSWQARERFAFELLNCPHKCPVPDHCVASKEPQPVYRANFYRINQLTSLPGGLCSGDRCEYMAWSPTLIDPPAFHEPTKFGYLVLAK